MQARRSCRLWRSVAEEVYSQRLRKKYPDIDWFDYDDGLNCEEVVFEEEEDPCNFNESALSEV